MIKNYLKIAWRNIIGSKIYSALNILGLAAGMAVALLIGLWVQYEYSYDKYLPNYSRIYQVMRHPNFNGEITTVVDASFALEDKLRSDIPGIESITETDYGNGHSLIVGNKKLYLNGLTAGSNYFSIFQFPTVRGNLKNSLTDPFSIVLTESTAKSLFGKEDPIGRTVRIDNVHDLKVTAVLKELPANSSSYFFYVVPYAYQDAISSGIKQARKSSNFYLNFIQLYVLMRPGIAYAQVEPKLKNLEKKYSKKSIAEVSMHPLKDWHLYSDYQNGKAVGGFIDRVEIFSVVGTLVLIIACINFINLTTARSEKRAREVGVRKAIGSQRKDLIFQFLTEAILTTFIAFFFSIVFVQIAIPYFNQETGAAVFIPYGNLAFWLLALCCALITGILGGSRPAFYLSSFNPVSVLKGRQSGQSNSLSRKVLVVLQFTCSISLIVSTMVVYQQVRYAQKRPLGYSVNRIVQTDMNEELRPHYNAIKAELLESGLVTNVAFASSPSTDIYDRASIQWQGQKPGELIDIGVINSSGSYFQTLGMSLLSGRIFNGDGDSDSTDVILNEAAVRQMHLKNPIAQSIIWHSKKRTIIGVVKNALMKSPYDQPAPCMFLNLKDRESFLIYKMSPQANPEEVIDRFKPIFEKYNPSYPYTYSFEDQSLADKFAQEVTIGHMAGVFAALAIFISCLGLFGLSTFIAEQRAKEVSIRKVLGASVTQVWLLLSSDFIVLILLSCLIASPLAYYFLQNWLLKYSYRITIGADVFLVAGVSALLVTLVTISYQAIKAALANPVKSLRNQ